MQHVVIVEGDIEVVTKALADAGVVMVDQPLVADWQVRATIHALRAEPLQGQPVVEHSEHSAETAAEPRAH
jgi:hypothetical protein